MTSYGWEYPAGVGGSRTVHALSFCDECGRETEVTVTKELGMFTMEPEECRCGAWLEDWEEAERDYDR